MDRPPFGGLNTIARYLQVAETRPPMGGHSSNYGSLKEPYNTDLGGHKAARTIFNYQYLPS
jgi:hypothetical protein